jgi:hypothetical protein
MGFVMNHVTWQRHRLVTILPPTKEASSPASNLLAILSRSQNGNESSRDKRLENTEDLCADHLVAKSKIDHSNLVNVDRL